MDGDREIFISIFSICSPLTLRQRLYRGSAKDVSNSQKGKPRLDRRKQLPESVGGSNQYKGSIKLYRSGALGLRKTGSLI